MAPIQHLSDLCQKEDNLEAILSFLRQRVRGPSDLQPIADLTAATDNENEEKEETTVVDGESSKYADLMRYQDSDGRTALHWAIAMRNFALAETLLRSPYQAPALTWDKGRCTPFLSACMVGAEEALLQLLLDRCVLEYPEVCRWLAAELGEAEAGSDAAAGAGTSSAGPNANGPTRARTSGGDANEDEDEDGRRLAELCPIQRLPPSIWGGHPIPPSGPTGASSEATHAGRSKTEEEEAAAKKREKMVSLVEAVVVNAGDGLGNSPLLTAVSRGHLRLIAYLLDHGADIAAQNKQGQTVLHRAVSKSNYNLVELLIQKSASLNGGEKTKGHRQFVNKPDRRGDTALFYASMENDEEIGSYLLQHGADRDLKNKEGKYFYEV